MQRTLLNKLTSLAVLGFLVWGISAVSGKTKDQVSVSSPAPQSAQVQDQNEDAAPVETTNTPTADIKSTNQPIPQKTYTSKSNRDNEDGSDDTEND